VLIHVDTELGAKDLLNNRIAYFAVSRGAYDAQLFTDSREKLGSALGHDVSHQSAHKPDRKPRRARGRDSQAGKEPGHGHWIEPLSLTTDAI
jgi:hypothetical protein